MLRITTHDKPDSMTFQLEGKLARPWVQELEKFWRSVWVDDRTRSLRFDLTSVTVIDSEGKEFLTARYGEGAEFVAAGCWMKSILAEITVSPVLVRRLECDRKENDQE
jgi:hypothetical protein